MSLRRAAGWFSLASMFVGCQLIANIDDKSAPVATGGRFSSTSISESSTSSSSSSGGCTAQVGCAAGHQCVDGGCLICMGKCGTPGCGFCPELTQVHNTTQGDYAIDAYEVTNALYAAFLAAEVSLDVQPTVCAWNTTFTPANWPLEPKYDQYPVVNVNWCQAHAYCAWAGERLCGAIGGGASPWGSYKSSTNQWFMACTANLSIPCGQGIQGCFPYGTPFDASACETHGSLLAVGSLPACKGGIFGAMFDMSGNAWEWEDSCADGSADDWCEVRGGAFDINDNVGYSDCRSNGFFPRKTMASDVGFRCCSDP